MRGPAADAATRGTAADSGGVVVTVGRGAAAAAMGGVDGEASSVGGR